VSQLQHDNDFAKRAKQASKQSIFAGDTHYTVIWIATQAPDNEK
jgi:hypothetical protein